MKKVIGISGCDKNCKDKHHHIMTVKVEMHGKEYWKRYLVEDGKVPKVAKDQLQDLVDDLLDD